MSAPFHLYSRGQRFEGTYEIDGRTLTVRSAFGTRRAALGVMKPLKLAKTLYRTLLRDVCTAPAGLPEAAATTVREAPHLH